MATFNGSEYTRKPFKCFDFLLSKFYSLHVCMHKSVARKAASFMNVFVQS